MKKLFTFLFALVASIGIANAEIISGTCGPSLIWYLDDETYTLTISGSGTMNSYDSAEDRPWPAGIETVIINNGVTSIGNYAFAGCILLTSVSIPNSVTSIGDGAFISCWDLHSITIPNSVTSIGYEAFAGCVHLTSVTIPNSVTSIGKRAFHDCYRLTSVTIGNSVTSIGDEAFAACNSLSSITIPNSVKSIGQEAFRDAGLTSVTIGNGVTSIDTFAFYRCADLKSLTIPNSVKSIGLGAFAGCISLPSITIPDSITSIEPMAFGACLSLSSITIPNSVTSIGYMAFRHCDMLTSVTIPNSVTNIDSLAFYDCSSLTKITCLGTVPPAINDSTPETTFSKNNYLHIYVPCEAVDAYISAWPAYKYNIYTYGDCSTHEGSIGYENITVRLDPTSCASWSDVYLWAWTDEGDIFDTWPGIKVTPDADGWYSHTFSAGVDNVNIIWSNGSGLQTKDIQNITSSTCYTVTTSPYSDYLEATVVDCSDIIPSAIEEMHSDVEQISKLLRDGQLLILRGDKTYTVTGQEVK